MTVAIVQSAFARGNGSPLVATLAAAPTAGNLILAVYGGRNMALSLSPALPVASLDQADFNPYQGTQSWYGRVSAPMGPAFTLSGMSDWGNFAVFELSGASDYLNVLAAPCGGTGSSVSTPALYANADVNGLNLLALTWDNGVGISPTPAGWTQLSPGTWQNTGNYHDAGIFEIPNATSGVQPLGFNASLDAQGAVLLNIQLWTTTAPLPGKTFWDMANRGTLVVSGGSLLQGGGLLALSLPSTPACVRSNRQLTAALSYFEATISTLAGNLMLGICSENFNLSGATLPGADNNALGYAPSGALTLNNAPLATLQAFAQGNVVQVAIDITNRLIWFNVNGGHWNNAAPNDPATGVGGLSFATLGAANRLFAVAGFGPTGSEGVSANFTGPFAYPVPSGFASLDLVGVNATVNLGQSVTDALSTGFNGPNQYALFGNGRLGWSGTISGTVQENGAAAAKVVRLYDEASGQLLGEARSDPLTGAYAISGMGRAAVYAVALDTPNFNALVLDNLSPL